LGWGQQTNFAPQVGLPVKILFWGAHPDPGPTGPPLQKGLFALRIGWELANKSWSSGWVGLVNFFLFWLTLARGPQCHPTKRRYLLLSYHPEIWQVLLISPGLDIMMVAPPTTLPTSSPTALPMAPATAPPTFAP
jgi:hypothetical protein